MDGPKTEIITTNHLSRAFGMEMKILAQQRTLLGHGMSTSFQDGKLDVCTPRLLT